MAMDEGQEDDFTELLDVTCRQPYLRMGFETKVDIRGVLDELREDEYWASDFGKDVRMFGTYLTINTAAGTQEVFFPGMVEGKLEKLFGTELAYLLMEKRDSIGLDELLGTELACLLMEKRGSTGCERGARVEQVYTLIPKIGNSTYSANCAFEDWSEDN